MRALVISDIHANLAALDAVLETAPEHDAVWCLGDLVGYGPDPNQCIERIAGLDNLTCLIGNHDQASLGLIPLSRFNRDAGAAVAWTQQIIEEENKTFLEALPSKVTHNHFTIVHGSPNQPIWEYILDPMSADRNFEAFESDFCLVGHSHLPLIFHRPFEDSFAMSRPVQWDEVMALTPRMILNPGSVGQPRDGDPRASFAILDDVENTWEMLRCDYDVKFVHNRIMKAGLPERHAQRLLAGW